MSCRCGSLYIPTGTDCTITVIDTAGNSLSATMNHPFVTLINNGNQLITYADMPSGTFNGDIALLKIEFDNEPSPHYTQGTVRVEVLLNNETIGSKYVGVKNQTHEVPSEGIICGCSNILNDDNVAGQRLFIKFSSVCVRYTDNCGIITNNTFIITDQIKVLCGTPSDEPDSDEQTVSYDYDCDTRDCVAVSGDSGLFDAYADCFNSINSLCGSTTTTTCDPNDPTCTTTVIPPPPVAPIWTQAGSFIPSVEDANMAVISDDGKVVAISEFAVDSGGLSQVGFVRCYEWSDNDWSQRGETIWGTGNFNNFGSAITLNSSGTLLGVSSRGSSDDFSVFEWNGSSWSSKGSVWDWSGTDAGGISITNNGQFIAYGDPGYSTPNTDNGGVEVREWLEASGDWVQTRGGNVFANSARFNSANDSVGFDVSISANGNYVVAGSKTDSAGGTVEVFEWNAASGEWYQRGSSILGVGPDGDDTGWDVEMSDDGSMITIGSQYTDTAFSNAGVVKTYVWNGSDWVKFGSDIQGGSTDAYLGRYHSTSLGGNKYMSIGEYGYNYNAPFGLSGLGRIRVYSSGVAGWDQRGTDIISNTNGANYGTDTSINSTGDVVLNLTSSGVQIYHFQEALFATTTPPPTTAPPTTTPAPTTTTTTTTTAAP